VRSALAESNQEPAIALQDLLPYADGVLQDLDAATLRRHVLADTTSISLAGQKIHLGYTLSHLVVLAQALSHSTAGPAVPGIVIDVNQPRNALLAVSHHGKTYFCSLWTKK